VPQALNSLLFPACLLIWLLSCVCVAASPVDSRLDGSISTGFGAVVMVASGVAFVGCQPSWLLQPGVRPLQTPCFMAPINGDMALFMVWQAIIKNLACHNML
jgi:hypothetical protein